MSKSLILMIGVAVGLTLFFSSCDSDDIEDIPSIDIPLAFLSPMAAGDYTVRITITAADISNPIIKEQNLEIVEGRNENYEVAVNNVPVGNRREVKVEVFKTGNRLFMGAGTVNISSGANLLAMRLEKIAELLSSEPKAGAQLLNTESLTLNFSAPPGTVTVNGKHAAVQGQTAIWSVSGMAAGKTNLNITWTAAGGGSDTFQVIIIGSPATVAITPTSTTLTAVGETVQLQAAVRDTNNNAVSNATVSWRSSNTAVASVNTSGQVTARGNGTATITATSGGQSANAAITVNATINMVLIPAGTFQMGSDDSDAQGDEEPVHTVYVDAFYMDIYEVTNAQYKRFVDANPQWSKSRISRSYHTGDYLQHWTGNSYPSGKGNYPVTHVSWFAAMAYAQWAGKRLPTEAEWEKAARGGLVGKKYPWGDSIDSSRANYGRNAGDTTPVGNYPRNGYGLYDMAGNVSEWCLDAYQKDFYTNSPYRNPIAGGTITSTTGNFINVTTKRVLRGGSWFENPKFVRVPSRPWSPPAFAYDGYGFRCARAE